MPITFSINYDEGYLIATYTGKISDEELLDSWKELYDGDNRIVGLNILDDLSQADVTSVTADGIKRLASYASAVYAMHKIHSVKNAVYAPDPLPFGLARMYDAMAMESASSIEVFQSIQEAESWLKETTNE